MTNPTPAARLMPAEQSLKIVARDAAWNAAANSILDRTTFDLAWMWAWEKARAAPAAQPPLDATMQASENDGAVRFAGLVLAEHRNDGQPCDLDGDFMQQAALDCGLIEERVVTEPCISGCACADNADFPTVCYFVTEAGRAAIAKGKAP